MALTLDAYRQRVLLGRLTEIAGQARAGTGNPIDDCIAFFYAHGRFGWTGIFRLKAWSEFEQHLGVFTRAALRRDDQESWHLILEHCRNIRYTLEDVLDLEEGPFAQEPLAWKAASWACAHLHPAQAVTSYLRLRRQEILPLALWASTEIVRAELGDDELMRCIAHCDEAAAIVAMGKDTAGMGSFSLPFDAYENPLNYMAHYSALNYWVARVNPRRTRIHSKTMTITQRGVESAARELLSSAMTALAGCSTRIGL